MNENIMTIAMWVMVIMICMLYCACVIIPLIVTWLGIKNIRKNKKKSGYILLIVGILIEIIVIIAAIIKFVT